ncbi:MAG: sigma-70 family RNA polymerase sigma factor [Acidobacteria bacterium]|nr:sigma-70 family RNA polymerase sigma factor [Acidobacteriota bacterium]
MDSADKREITRFLVDWRNGDGAARDELLSAVYDELRRRAGKIMASERTGHTLQPTALVHEALMRFERSMPESIDNRLHFYALVSRIMRQLLIDHARTRSADKRGGKSLNFSLSDLDAPVEDRAASIVALNEAINVLEKEDARLATVVEMRFFGGMSNAEIAEALDISERTVIREWHSARLWLYNYLSE